MTHTTTVTYTCQECGYTNIWMRDEIIRRGRIDAYRSQQSSNEDYYSLKCRNPAFDCPGRWTVAVERKEHA